MNSQMLAKELKSCKRVDDMASKVSWREDARTVFSGPLSWRIFSLSNAEAPQTPNVVPACHKVFVENTRHANLT